MSSDSPQASPLRCFTLPWKIKILACTDEDVPRLEWYGLFTQHRKIIHSTWERTLHGKEVMLVARVGDFPIGQVWIDLEKPSWGRAECILGARRWIGFASIGADAETRFAGWSALPAKCRELSLTMR